MTRRFRLSLSPSAAVAVLALFFALGGSALAVGERLQAPAVAQQRCTNGAVRGIAVVTGIPSQGIANFPDAFTSARNLFARRFNCTGKAVQARRVEAGVFEVRFVGISGASGVGSAVSDAYTTVEALPGGVFRVIMHPAGRDDRADLPFTVVVL
ncbi:MAG TPA: hypothetical protein VFO64_07520 [Gaiellaceae bacterium]|jgi:hypothetical protein|nr:hypothetical protein [Gaiellaceae bacterium]